MSARHGWFVTGTDTGVGKTLVSAALLHALGARGLRVAGMKPIAAGVSVDGQARRNDDVEQLAQAGNVDLPAPWRCPYLLREPVAPHLAAQREGVTIELPRIVDAYRRIAERCDAVVVEGVGGFCVPLSEATDAADATDTADLAVQLGLPVILVVGLRLGCLNHALLTAQAIAARGLPLAGWVANRVDPAMRYPEANVDTLTARLPAPLLGCLPVLTPPAAAVAAAHLNLDPLLASSTASA